MTAEIATQPEAALANQQQPMPDWLGRHVGKSFSTIDMTCEKGLVALSKCQVQSDQAIGDMVGREIEIESFFMKPYDRLDEQTGELVPLVFTAVITPAGEVYGCSSLGIRSCLLTFASIHGYQPWIPSLRVRIVQQKAKIGKVFGLFYLGRGEMPPATKVAKKDNGK